MISQCWYRIGIDIDYKDDHGFIALERPVIDFQCYESQITTRKLYILVQYCEDGGEYDTKVLQKDQGKQHFCGADIVEC